MEGLPELRHILSTVGKIEAILGQSSEGVYLSQTLLKFSERTERTITIDELMDEVRSGPVVLTAPTGSGPTSTRPTRPSWTPSP